ncbi:hypothetical protein C7B77_10525 [Chamaesiphon polymorphus CCALA 037]|uniref:CopG family transcriptional regulator n=2 Tax=Chamaesiphon TaxID=217161 RepID=A0A2T1GGN8_9CYAN|nr:hypothetical protein C7B77_10525 [Chamaesiphon polymorphus CCALA 037]
MADNAAVNNFVFGDNAPTPAAEPVVEAVEPIIETVETVNDWVEPKLPELVEPIPQSGGSANVEAPAIAAPTKQNGLPSATAIAPQPSPSLISKLMQNTPEKEATVRLTVDLPKSTHTKLSVLCAHNGLKKAEVVRMLLDEALKDTNV